MSETMGAEEWERLLKKLERDQYGTTAAMLRAHIDALQREADELRAALQWAERALAPFSIDPQEKSGMAKIRAALSKATGKE